MTQIMKGVRVLEVALVPERRGEMADHLAVVLQRLAADLRRADRRAGSQSTDSRFSAVS